MQNRNLIITSFIVIVATIVLVSYMHTNEKKTAFINLKQVFEEFEYKKEMEGKLKAVQQERQKIIDSLEFELRLFAKQLESERKPTNSDIVLFEAKRDDLSRKQQQFEEDNTALIEKYDKQIIGQLNQYVADFGQKEGYKYIFGNDGNGNIMYGSESENVTSQVIKFINNRYKGVN